MRQVIFAVIRIGIMVVASVVVFSLVREVMQFVSETLNSRMIGYSNPSPQVRAELRWELIKESMGGLLILFGFLSIPVGLVIWGWVALLLDIKRRRIFCNAGK